MKTFFKIVLVLFLGVNSLQAKTIKVSSQTGNSVEKLKKAYNKAKAGDTVLIDIDVVFRNTDKHFLIEKSGITFKGEKRADGKKFEVRKEHQKLNLFLLKVGFTTFENISFKNATNLLRIEAKDKTLSTITIKDCNFSNGGYTGIDFRGDFTNILVENTFFDDCKFSLQTMDSEILKNFLVTKCTFKRGDHQISIDNAFAKTDAIDHANIVIDDCVFYVAARFNIALANTRNVIIQNNSRMDGGLQGYSQAIHIEHDTRDVLIKNNTMKNDVGNAIIIFSTGYTGHGNGRKIPDEEKIDFGSSNITLDGNTITSSKKNAIAIGYGRGFLKIKDNNIINSEEKIIGGYQTKNTMTFDIDENVLMNGIKFKDISKDKLKDFIFIKN
ncbi:right-handed parallel beta-helix repeat-containing protein [Polaribacter sp. Q13]|uniref:right-handed parallel beta-helix repeat-containing protein n=1 Tax=Polaribacter sp. Q13 TaxID=2806551 RepID=UPI00193BEEBC|nr:right-handed parallel beta-helix repeat-containing protein [Polaribacter sp. Q13]QVY66589.1 right-handed parallel beta-helix repeat-containing protein [Polaribacter sp. Q13]